MSRAAFFRPSIRAGFLAAALLATTILPPSPALGAAGRHSFVERDGTSLVLDGEPWRFTGVNIYNANSDGWCGHSMDAVGGIGRAFDELGPGHNVVRAWFFQPLALNAARTERDWTRFDATVEAARQRGIKLIATLGNQWGECGNKVAAPARTDEFYRSLYTTVEPGHLTSYRDFVAEVVQRYRHDPTIAMWQLMNEAETKTSDGQCAPDGATLLRDFAADVSGLIKSIDPNQLVSLGTMGGPQCGPHREGYETVHDVATIDVCEYHDYSPTEAMPTWTYEDNYDNGLASRIAICSDLGKPLFVGEAGIPRTTGLQARADMFRAKVNAQFEAGVVGFLAWNFSSIELDPNYDIRPGDPAIGALRHDDAAPDSLVGTLFVAGLDADRLYLHLNDLVDPWSIPDPSDFSVRVDGGAPQSATSVQLVYRGLYGSFLDEELDGRGTSILSIGLPAAVEIGQLIEVSYVPGARQLRDDFGNVVPGFQDRGLDVDLDLDPQPFFAFVDEGTGPDVVLIAFVGVLQHPLPPREDFTVTINGSVQPVVALEQLHADAPVNFLALRTADPVAYGDEVTVQYVPSGTPLMFVGGSEPVSGWDAPVNVSVRPTPTRQTQAGEAVSVQPVDSTTGITPATITFAFVTGSGTTTVVSTTDAPALPTGFRVADRFYDITTTATVAGEITVCMSYPEGTTGDLRLLHHEDGEWIDITTSHDVDARVLCGVTTSLSPFVVTIYEPTMTFGGFLRPIDPLPTLNKVKAGSAVPVRFSLGGDFGLDIFDAGYPKSGAVSCDARAPVEAVEETVNAGGSSLSYDPISDTYTYVWKTNKTWTGCRDLVLRFGDDTDVRAAFRLDR